MPMVFHLQANALCVDFYRNQMPVGIQMVCSNGVVL
jgi:hypothetical protein